MRGNWVTLGREGSNEVGSVSVEVIRTVTDATPLSGKGVRDGTFGLYGVTVVVMEILL